jgi:hypothetical protein
MHLQLIGCVCGDPAGGRRRIFAGFGLDLDIPPSIIRLSTRLPMKALLSLLVLVLLSLNPSIAADSIEETPVIKLAKEIKLPKVEFRKATIMEAIEFLNAKSKSIGSKQQSVNIAVAGKIDEEGKVSLSLQDASLYDILLVIAAQADMELKPSETVTMLVPKTKP